MVQDRRHLTVGMLTLIATVVLVYLALDACLSHREMLSLLRQVLQR